MRQNLWGGLLGLAAQLAGDAVPPDRAALLRTDEAAGFRVVETREFYRLDAAEIRALRTQLRETRLKTGFDGKSAGLTRQSLHTHYRLEPQGQACRLADLAVTVEVTIHLPEWVPAKPTKSGLREAWAAMLAGLTLHEEGHRDNAVAAGRELHSRLAGLGTDRDCLRLGRAAQREAFRAQVRFQLRDRNYDRRTRHGESQGSRL